MIGYLCVFMDMIGYLCVLIVHVSIHVRLVRGRVSLIWFLSNCVASLRLSLRNVLVVTLLSIQPQDIPQPTQSTEHNLRDTSGVFFWLRGCPWSCRLSPVNQCEPLSSDLTLTLWRAFDVRNKLNTLTTEHALAVLCMLRSPHRVGEQLRHCLLVLRGLKSEEHLCTRAMVTAAELYIVVGRLVAKDSRNLVNLPGQRQSFLRDWKENNLKRISEIS